MSILKVAYKALEEKFAKDIVVLDIQNISILADYFIIASVGNQNQIHAIVGELEKKLNELDVKLLSTEGYGTSNWVLLNFGSMIVHLFVKDERGLYKLEKVWGDAKLIDCADID